jgi:hypothetical protein
VEQDLLSSARVSLWEHPSMVFQDDQGQTRVHFGVFSVGEPPLRRAAFTMFKLEEGRWIQTGQLAIFGVSHTDYASSQAKSYARGKGLRFRNPEVEVR